MSRRPTNRKIPGWMAQVLPDELSSSSVLKFSVSLPNGQKVDLDLRHDVDVDYDLLEHQLEECPAQLVWWGSLLSEVKLAVSILERKLKARRAALTNELTKMMKEGGAPKLTDNQVKLVIEEDETLNQLEARLALTQKHAGKLYYMVSAIQMKSENLRSLAGFKRQEQSNSR